jgi:hypothetical protein
VGLTDRAGGGLRRLKYLDLTLIAAVFLVVWALLAYFLWNDIYRNADTAQLRLLTESTGKYGVPYNQVGASVFDEDWTRAVDAKIVCDAPLTPGPESYPNGQFSHLAYHAYYFAYALAPLTWFLPTDVVIAGTQALAVVGTLLVVGLILRQERVGLVGGALLCALVAAYPVVNGALTSVVDLYMDRYFPPLALLYLALLYYGLLAPGRPWARFVIWALPVGIVAASTNDRSMLYLIGANLGVIALMGRSAFGKQWRAALALIAFSAVLTVAFVAYMDLVHTSDINTIGGFAARWSGLVALLTNPAPFRFDQSYAELSLKFLVVNALLFGIWGFWRWPLMLIALGAMLPNILTTLGGAEKVQFGFPYHSDYLPFVLLAVSVGFAGVWRVARSRVWRAGLAAIVALTAVSLVTLDPYQPGWVFSNKGLSQSGLYYVARFYADIRHSDAVARKSYQDEVARAVPTGVSVTSPQGLAGALYPGREWYFYPLGIDTADYAVVTIEKDTGDVRYFGGAESYTGQERELNVCLTQRLARDGYNVDNPRIIGSVAILRRTA